MPRLLTFSLAAAGIAVAALAYQLGPFRSLERDPATPRPDILAEPAAVDPSGQPVRTIPLSGSAPPAAAKPLAPVATAVRPDAVEPHRAQPGDPGPDAVPRSADGTAVTPTGTDGLSPSQVEAIRRQAARRQVRPVTRMSFPLERGASVPAQVFLHPLPPDAEGIAGGPDKLGFVVVGDRYVVVDAQTRTVVAVGG